MQRAPTIIALSAVALAAGCGIASAPRPNTGAGASVAASQSADRLEVRHDGDHVTLRVRPPSAVSASADELYLIAGVTFRHGERARGLRTVLVGFRRVGARFRFASCRSITFSADGAAVGQAPLRHEAQIGGKRVHELIFALLPATTTRKLAEAKRMSVDICGEHFVISDGEHRQLRRFVARLAALNAAERRPHAISAAR